MPLFQQPISEYIWQVKYRYKNANRFFDNTIEDSWQRIANAAASVECDKNFWQKKFYQILEDFIFLPGGRILAGAGTQHQVTLFNCFVMKIAEDSISAIFKALKEGALTLQQGGGVGYDFSIIRPNGYSCQQTNSTASGPISFMKIWDAMSATMLSSGARRGAMMANLRCDHPDIESFIAIKADSKELRHFNLSVIITDDFMQAVKNDAPWHLVFPSNKNHNSVLRRGFSHPEPIPCQIIKTISAKKLWQQIIASAYDYAEPGVIFEDTINTFNPLWYAEWISATNPCGEIPLPFYGACNLGSINLTQFVSNAFTKAVKIDWSKLENITAIATRFLDNVIDISHYPLRQQHVAAMNTRRIGLGFTGLADALFMMGIKYGSDKSLMITQQISKIIAETTWSTSISLAEEKGKFPLYDERYLSGQFVLNLPHEIQKDIVKFGIRNSHHNAIAPAGSISLLANNISGGIEPIFAARYERQVRQASGEIIGFSLEDYAFKQWQAMQPQDTPLPETWTEVKTLTPTDHLKIQAVVQPYIDNAISKTINLPVDYPFEKSVAIFTQAYAAGLKGCTIFRPNPITGSILSAEVDSCCSLS